MPSCEQTLLRKARPLTPESASSVGKSAGSLERPASARRADSMAMSTRFTAGLLRRPRRGQKLDERDLRWGADAQRWPPEARAAADVELRVALVVQPGHERLRQVHQPRGGPDLAAVRVPRKRQLDA